MKKLLFSVIIGFTAIVSYTQAVLFSIEKLDNIQGGQAGPYMAGCDYDFNIRMDSQGNTFPNTVADVRINFPVGTTTINSFTPGSAYDNYITNPIIGFDKIQVSRFSFFGSVKNNALFGIVNFTPSATTNSNSISFSYPFTPLSPYGDANNFPDDNNNDLLTNVSGATYTVVTGPCIRDMIPPTFDHTNSLTKIGGGQTNGPNATRISQNSNIVFNITENTPDAGGSTEYGYNGSWVYTPGISNNQFGVDPTSLEIIVTQSPYRHKYLAPSGLGTGTKNYFSISPEVTMNPSDLTWERLDRNYQVTIDPLSPQETFFPERKITVYGTTTDRFNKWGTRNVNTFTYHFNLPEPPIITPIYPLPNDNVTQQLTAVILSIKDNRAGVDIDTVEILLDGVPYNTGSTGFSYISGLLVSGQPEFGDIYTITITPSQTLTFGSSIKIIVNGKDLVNNSTSASWNFNYFSQSACGSGGLGGGFGGGGFTVNIGLQASGTTLVPVPGNAFSYGLNYINVIGSAYIDGDDIVCISTPSGGGGGSSISYVGGGGGGGTQTVYLSGGVIYISSGEAVKTIDGEENFFIAPGEDFIYIKDQVERKIPQGSNVRIKTIPGEDNYILQRIKTGSVDTGEDTIIIQKDEIIKYIASGTTTVYVQPEQKVEYITKEILVPITIRNRSGRRMVVFPCIIVLILIYLRLKERKRYKKLYQEYTILIESLKKQGNEKRGE